MDNRLHPQPAYPRLSKQSYSSMPPIRNRYWSLSFWIRSSQCLPSGSSASALAAPVSSGSSAALNTSSVPAGIRSSFPSIHTGISAEDAYNKAVTYSMEENSVSAEDIADYLANAGKFTNDKKQIYYEEWVAMFKQGMEGWSLYRRTGVPDNLYPAPGRPANYSNHNVPPFRSPYPDKERNLNNANCAPFDAEVVDNLWGKQMWWDTRTGVH